MRAPAQGRPPQAEAAHVRPAAPAPAAGDEANATPALFGRGLLYVVVWSLQLVSATLVSPILAHLMGPGEFGALASAIALSQVLVAFAVLGLDQVLILLRAEEGHDGSARSVITLGLVAAVVVTTLAALTSPLWSEAIGFHDRRALVLIILAWTAPTAALQVVAALLLSQDRLKVTSVISLLCGVGGQLVGLTILIVSGSRSADVYAVGALITMSIALAIGLAVTRPRFDVAAAARLVPRSLSIGLPVMIGGLAIWVLNAADRLVIQSEMGEAAAGRYQVAYTVGNVAVMVIGVTHTVWMPWVANVRDEEARWLMLVRARDQLVRLLIPVMLGITLGAPVLLRIVAPSSFAPSSLLVIVFLIVLAAFPVAVGGSSGLALTSLQRTRAVAIAACVAGVVNLVLNLLLVPTEGIAGAAVATLVSFCVQALLQRLSLPASVRWPASPWRLHVAIGLGVAFCALTVAAPQTAWWNAARIVVALGCVPWLLRELRRARSVKDVVAPATA